jgi:hypothetical protein
VNKRGAPCWPKLFGCGKAAATDYSHSAHLEAVLLDTSMPERLLTQARYARRGSHKITNQIATIRPASGIEVDMRCIFIIAVTSVATWSGAANAQISALQVANQCRPIANHQPLLRDFETGFCLGFSGMYNFLANSRGPQNQPLLNVCIPPGVDNYHLVRLFVSYVDRNPGRSHLDYRFVLVEAMAQAYPCGRRQSR